MIKESEIRNNVAELKSLCGSMFAKYARNFGYYNNTPTESIREMRNPPTVGYYNKDYSQEQDTSATPNINVIKSCIDALDAKIAQSKVRPYFNAINGSFKDIQICHQSQQFFDQYFEIEEVNKKVAMVFRDACIFDKGVIYVDDTNKCITRALPWQVYYRPAEATYNNITRIYYEQADFPVTMLPEELKKKVRKNNKSVEYVTYGIYYDTEAKCKAQYVSGEDKMVITPYEGNRVPFIFLWYSHPIFGSSSISVVDMLKSIQLEINVLMDKIKDASQLNPALTFFVPGDGSLKTQQLDNKVGNVVFYRPTPDLPANPVTSQTPAFIDTEYINLVNELVQKAYELVGISQLSAQSKKPTGVDSGVGLQTLQDVESERYQTQLDQVIQCYIDIAKTCLRVFDKNEDILPEAANRTKIKWKDVVEEEKKMSIQFSAADSLSKDPSTKLDQLQKLAQAGVIPTSRIAQFMQLPDLEGGYSLSNNAINAVLTVIDECITNDSFDIPEYVPLTMLKEEIINTQLSLRAANYEKNKEDIEKLTKLYEKCDELDQEMQTEVNNETNTNNMGEEEGAVTEDGLPVQENVLDQVNSQEASQSVPETNPEMDLAVDTKDKRQTGWDTANQ